MNGVGDGVQQVGFSQTGFSVDKKRIVALSWIVGHCPGGGMGKLIGRTYHKAVEGIFLGAGEKIALLGLFFSGVQFTFRQNDDLKISGKKLMKSLLNGWKVSCGDDIPLETGRGIDGKTGFVQGDGNGIVKPGIDRCFSHLISHEGDYLVPYFGSRVHGLTSFCPAAGCRGQGG